MTNNDKTAFFRGYKNVSDNVLSTTGNESNNQQQFNSQTMASPTTPPSSQPNQFAFNPSKQGLPSLADAKDPSSLVNNQQQPTVGTFPQRTTGGSPTASNTSPLGASFVPPGQGFTFTKSPTTDSHVMSAPNQPSGNPAPFSFNTAAAGNSQNFSFTTATAQNPPRFSFNNAAAGNPQNFSFNNATPQNPPRFSLNSLAQGDSPTNSSQQPIASRVVTPSAQKHDTSINQLSSSSTLQQNQPTAHNMSPGPKQIYAAQTSTGQQPHSSHQDPDEDNTPASIAENSLVSKIVNTKLRDSNDLVVDRSDPSSPLYSTKKFEDLNLKPNLLKGIYHMGFNAPSKIQENALPCLLGNPPRNIIAQSQSGTGKTVAFSITVISCIDPAIRSPQALILAPTFELAIQIGSVIEKLARYLPYIQTAYAVRDPEKSKRSTRTRGQLIPEPIVIGTPGTVDEWCRKMKIVNLKQLRIFVVDEADVMIAAQGFRANCVDLVQEVNRSTCQMLLFSATYSDEIMQFAREIVPNQPVVLRLKREKQTLANIRQFNINCADLEEKYHVIERIYTNLTIGRAMIFCRTKKTAEELAVRMANQAHSVKYLTGNLEIEVRAAIIQQFRDGLFRVLISTNVTSRGIDIDGISLVMNYDMPITADSQPDYETYLHRIGRCGRFGKTGYTFNLIGSEDDYNVMKAIESYFAHTIDYITIDDIDKLAPDEE